MSAPQLLLVDLFPRAGFVWRRRQGSPRILRSDNRDAAVQRALIAANGESGLRIRKRDAQRLVVGAVALVAEKINDAESGMRPNEGIIEYLERSADFSELSRAMGPEVWAELIFQIADARNKYERTAPQAQKDGDRDRLTALAFAIDGLLDAAGARWDWMSLEFYAYPHLVGEAADYEIEESDEESDEEEEGGDDKMEEDAEDKDLPRQMEGLTLLDAEGDVEMGM